MKISVIGLGKIGLPLAVQYARKGKHVFGVDVNPDTVEKVNSGIEPFPGEAHLAEYLSEIVESGHLVATTDYSEAIPFSDVIVVVVPLFIDAEGEPDFGWMDSATQSIGENMSTNTLVIYETTLPVGTTRNRWAPKLQQLSGLVEGQDFHCVFSPERVLTGRVFEDLKKYPKVVGGLSVGGEQAAKAFYESVLDFDTREDLGRENGVWLMGTAEAAEMVKLAETTYRDVNIGLANQFARFADRNNIDVYRVIEACNSQPYSHIHQPGIAVGGHCIPVYPRLYLWNDPEATIVDAAREANLAMPEYAVSKLEWLLGDLRNKSILILGASYRGRVKETAFSGVFGVLNSLVAREARVFVHDPLYTDDELIALGLDPWGDEDPVDGVVLQADHPEYSEKGFTIGGSNVPIVDGRHCLPQGAGGNIFALGQGRFF